MWHKKLNENKFLLLLYDEIPELKDVRIVGITLGDEGRKLSIMFVMPKYADNPPKKWDDLKYNSIIIELDFYDIKNLDITSTNKDLVGDISIESNEKNTVHVHIDGNLSVNLEASGGIIQSIEGYIES